MESYSWHVLYEDGSDEHIQADTIQDAIEKAKDKTIVMVIRVKH